VVITVPSTPTQSPRSELVELVVALGPEHGRVDEQLDRAGAVAQEREAQAALVPDEFDTAGDAHVLGGVGVGPQRVVGRPDLRCGVVGGVEVGQPVSGTCGLELAQAVFPLVCAMPGGICTGRHHGNDRVAGPSGPQASIPPIGVFGR